VSEQASPAGRQVRAEALVAAEPFLGGMHVEVARQWPAVVVQDGLAIAIPTVPSE